MKRIIEYLNESAEKLPQNIAFKDENKEITYISLQKTAKSIGCEIHKLTGGVKNKPVAVFIDRNIESLVSFMGVIYSGNFYVPIDASQPQSRVSLILETLNPVLILGNEAVRKKVEKLSMANEVRYYEDLAEGDIDERRLDDIMARAIDTDPLYAMFTSGSTGIPKGAVISHLSAIDLVEQFSGAFKFNDETIFGNQAPFDFDVSVKDIYSAIKHGAKLTIIPKVCFSFPIKLMEFLDKEEINTCIWSTSVLRLVENMKGLDGFKPTHLRCIMFSGEVMHNKILNYWRNRLPDVQYVNLYGPTEITCNCSYYKVTRPYEDHEVLPIGSPFDNTEIFIIREDGKEAGIGEIGEICVRGSSLALGYYNNHETTDRVFIQNPLNPYYRDLIYKTGDLGKLGEDGLLYFVSRKDHQIKHMGHRIELGEIEVAANSLDFIHMGCCIYDKLKEKIILFYEAEEEKNKEIFKAMLTMLPKYMVPNKMIQFESLPLNQNGKIDRVRLTKEYLNA